MADNRPIGVFDSGLGGLTAMATLMAALPGEDICYLGDTGRVPYGSRSPETIEKYTEEDIAFLKSLDIKAIVVACGTVSAVALEKIKGNYNMPIYGVLEPTVKKAISVTKTDRIGILGTEATIKSGAYERLLRQTQADVELTSIPCPLFVPLVENGRVHPGDAVIETVVAEYLEPLKTAKIDTVILGCTHYPLLEQVIAQFLGEGVTLVSSGAAVAEYVAKDLAEEKLLSNKKANGTQRYFVTDSTAGFTKLASLFLQQDVSGEVKQITLTSD